MPDKMKPTDIKSIYQGSEIDFSILAEKSLVGIYLIQDGVFKYLNPKLAEIFEYTVEELINKTDRNEFCVFLRQKSPNVHTMLKAFRQTISVI